jgi:branched-chain amino acid transport system permease protein
VILEPAQLSFAYTFGASKLYLVFYAAVFLLVILLLPRGIIPSVMDLVARVGRRRAAGPSAPAATASDPHAVAGVQSP